MRGITRGRNPFEIIYLKNCGYDGKRRGGKKLQHPDTQRIVHGEKERERNTAQQRNGRKRMKIFFLKIHSEAKAKQADGQTRERVRDTFFLNAIICIQKRILERERRCEEEKKNT